MAEFNHLKPLFTLWVCLSFTFFLGMWLCAFLCSSWVVVRGGDGVVQRLWRLLVVVF